MTFFNKKEEVIDLVLTRLGREKLAVGEFRPTHYDFFDDEIVYDIKTLPSAPSIVELQNEITNRIKTVPTLKNQTGYQGSKKVTDHFTRAPFLFKSLGDSSVFNEEKPAWDVQVRQGRISGSVDFTPLEFPASSANSLGAFSQEKIPQLDVVCEYSFTRTEFKDHPGKYQLWLRKTSDDILLEIEEENTESTDDNFIIEVFEYEKDGAGNIIDAIPLKFSEEELNTGVVEYYFDITTDADAEETLEIKYVDQPLKKTVEVDKCDSTLESSCAREKIKQLKAEISKLKSEKFTASAAGEKTIKAAQAAAQKAVKDLEAATTVAGAKKAGEALKEIKKDADEAIKGTVKNGGLCADHGFGGVTNVGTPNNEKCKSGNCQKPAGHKTWICVGKDCPDCGLTGDYCGNNNECKSNKCAPTEGTKKKCV